MTFSEFKEIVKLGGKKAPAPPTGYTGKEFDFETFRNIYVSQNRNEKIQ